MDVGAVVSPPYLAGPLHLHPFRARLLQPSHIGDPSSARLFARPYRGVAGRLRQWESRGRITVDEEPAVYLHEYSVGGHTVRGLVGTLDLDRRASSQADSVVVPHEGIHPAQADVLADRMEEMEFHPAPILLVHRGTARLRQLVDRLVASAPTRQFEDAGGQRHRLWALRTAADLDVVGTELAGSRALMADGHHRYAAYLRVQARHPATPADRGLAMLVDHLDTPLQLRAIHRVLTGVRLADLQSAAGAVGVCFEYRPGPCLHDGDPATVVAADSDLWAVLRLPAHEGTVVEFVHDVLLPALPRGPRAVGYEHAPERAVATAARRRGTALLLPPPTIEQVLQTATAGRLLPEKATSFQPKPHVGVLMRSLRDEADAPT